MTKYSSGVCLSTRGWEYDHKPDSVDIFKMMQPSYYDGSKRPTRYYLATTEGRVARLTRTFNVRWKLFPSTSTTCSCAERRNHPIDERDGESVPRLSLAQHQSIGAPQQNSGVRVSRLFTRSTPLLPFFLVVVRAAERGCCRPQQNVLRQVPLKAADTLRYIARNVGLRADNTRRKTS